MFKETQEDELTRRTGLREMGVLRRLRHDNVAALLEAFTRGGRLFLVFEFVQRTVLDDLEASGSGLAPDLVRDVLWQLLCAVDFCHRSGIVHRDIKVSQPMHLQPPPQRARVGRVLCARGSPALCPPRPRASGTTEPHLAALPILPLRCAALRSQRTCWCRPEAW